jgi:hypothetical protein
MPKDKKDTNNNNAGIFRVLEFITEVFGWLQIVISPLLIGLGIGAIIYFPQSIKYKIDHRNNCSMYWACCRHLLGNKKMEREGDYFFSLPNFGDA